MPEKTPVTTRSTAGFVDPGKGLWAGTGAAATALLNTGGHRADRNGYKLSIFYFSNIDDTDTWTSGLKGVQATAWQADRPDADEVGCVLTNAATGEITFTSATANSNGWLWVFHAT